MSLGSLIDDLHERVYNLKLFDKNSEVNIYCDELESQVILAVESAILHLNDVKKELLQQISRYRAELVESNTERLEDKSDLELLEAQVKLFKQEYSSLINAGQENFEAVQKQYEEYKKTVSDVGKRFRRLAFNGGFMRFNQNRLFSLTYDNVGRLEKYEDELADDLISNVVLDEYESTMKVFQVVPPNPDRRWDVWPSAGDINSLLYLMNGNLAIAPGNDFIQIWNPHEEKLVYKLETKCWSVLAFAQMPNGYLIVGDVYGRIEVWDLDSKNLVRNMVGHKSSICSFLVLADGKVASFSQDDSIIIWNPYQENSLVLKITGHENPLAYPPLGLLSNGFMVTSNSKVNIIRIWSPRDGKLVKELPISLPNIKNFYVMPNDDIALVTADGSVRILNLLELDSYRPLSKSPGTVVAMTHRTNNRSILVLLKNPNLSLFESQSSNYRMNIIESLDFSPDQKILATVGSSGRIVLWFISS